ncbi:MAG: hypothetical protein ACFFB0_01730 [Promethearchaeota archaeon]
MKEDMVDKSTEIESSKAQEEEGKKSRKRVRKTQGQIIQEALGLDPIEIQNVEKKLFIVRFLDYFGEETLEFIFKDNTIKQYLSQITTHINTFIQGREEDILLKQSFESKNIPGIIENLKLKAEELALSKGIKTSMSTRLRRLNLIVTLPLLAVVFAFAFLPFNLFIVFPILCVLCMIPQLIRGTVVKKWFTFKDQNKNQIYSENREEIMILKTYAGEVLNNIRSRLLELKVPLQLIKFMLHSRDYENLSLLNQSNVRGTMQYFYTFEYPPDMEPLPIPEQLMQYEKALFPERKERPEKNFIVLTEMKGMGGVITYFVPTLKDAQAEKINKLLNESEFSKAPQEFKSIIPNFSENLFIYCVCGEVVEFTNIQICNWKNQFKFYLFEGKECKCGETVYVLSLMDESDEVPEELKEIFLS